jgi:enoyl-CoA hydratase
MAETLRAETVGAVRTITLCRPEVYNNITPALARELGDAIDAADDDRDIKVILLQADGKAFCAGYGLDWSTAAQANADAASKVWDIPTDLHGIGKFVAAYQKLWYCSKPTIAAPQGWCICGGTDMVLWADQIIAGESTVFGYPTSRLWGVPTTPMWIYRVGFERAKRYLLSGDEISATEAERIGLVGEVVPDDQLHERAMERAQRMAQLPLNQLQMIKLYCNQAAENMGLRSTATMGMILDGQARHTQEGVDFAAHATEIGFRQAVRERDDPFGDYGSRPRS